LHYYTTKILEGNSYEWAENEIKNSHEKKIFDIKSKITSLYQKYLERAPDVVGLHYYTTKILEGNSYEWAENEIKNSTEKKEIEDLKKYFLN
jgi:low affinity Fe/Cu permease